MRSDLIISFTRWTLSSRQQLDSSRSIIRFFFLYLLFPFSLLSPSLPPPSLPPSSFSVLFSLLYILPAYPPVSDKKVIRASNGFNFLPSFALSERSSVD